MQRFVRTKKTVGTCGMGASLYPISHYQTITGCLGRRRVTRVKSTKNLEKFRERVTGAQLHSERLQRAGAATIDLNCR
jgi:hypothetical protein